MFEPQLSLTHQAFADLVLAGHSPAAAYELVGYKAKTPQSRASNSHRLMKNADISAYISAKRKSVEDQSDFDRAKADKMIVEILQAAPQDASLANPLCEIRYTADGPVAVFPSKSKMLDLLSKMRGWNAPVKVETDGTKELAQALATMKNTQ